MAAFILWYLVISLLGWLAFPLTFRWFGHLKDRGFGLSKVLGLLLWGYLFWLLNILHIGQNTVPGLVLALLVVLGVSTVSLRKADRRRDLLDWIKEHYSVIIFSEVLFLALFALWTVIRAASPDIIGTEKPMELAFINAVLRSPTFPPRDPWLSGYAISYYYFGYVMIAMLVKLTGTAAWVGFNLASALWFGLSGSAAFSLVYNLLPGRRSQSLERRTAEPRARDRRDAASLFWALLGPLYLLIVSNVEGFLEMLHARGLFWQPGPDGGLQSRFWHWLDIQELTQPPAQPFGWVPERLGGIWWWRASRVLQDFTAAGQSKEVIDEFPFFSYLLSDLHPHVLAIPFGLLAAAFALNFFRSYQPPEHPGISLYAWFTSWYAGESRPLMKTTLFPLLARFDFWFLAFLTGSLAFLNTWDFPIYVGLFAAVYGYRRYQAFGWSAGRIIEFLSLGLFTGIAGVLMFLPFYIGFSSQAGGVLPSLFFFTRGVHLWTMFLPLLFPLAGWLVYQLAAGRAQLRNGLLFAVLVVTILWAGSYLMGAAAAALPGMAARWSQSSSTLLQELSARLQHLGGLFYSTQGIQQPADIWVSLRLRFQQPGAWITLGLLITAAWSLLAARPHREGLVVGEEDRAERGLPTGSRIGNNGWESLTAGNGIFMLLLVLLGGGLVLFPEFFYLRDQFGWRINTIFKFYYQAWVLWSIAAAAASAWLWRRLGHVVKLLFGVAWTVVLLVALVYPYWGVKMKLEGLDPARFTLNGAQHIENYSPDEMRAIEWLLEAPDGVVLEAVGGSYSGFARVSTYTGLPTVLGWPGHESQWRGGAEEMGTREEDIRQMYQSSNWQETLLLLQNYNIRYVYIGSYEKTAYRVSETKFEQYLDRVFESDNVVIYEAPYHIREYTEGVK